MRWLTLLALEARKVGVGCFDCITIKNPPVRLGVKR